MKWSFSGLTDVIAGDFSKLAFGKLATRQGMPRDARRPKWADPTRYDGAKLREIRARKGVGRPPETWEHRSHGRSMQAWQANRMAAKLCPYILQRDRDKVAKWWPMPIYRANLAEWERKPRPGNKMKAVSAIVLRDVRRGAWMSRREFDKTSRGKPETWEEIQTYGSRFARQLQRASKRLSANVARNNPIYQRLLNR